ncbi:MAG: hypothetical protein AB1649_13280 [Chloroflexota bacterium]
MPDITCPVCGEVNPADQEFCQSCQSRLRPASDPFRDGDTTIKSGQMPTKKHTAELEPILPQWLREARDTARKSAEEQAASSAQEPASQSNASPPDLLAGLQSQKSDDEDETPDWLASITGAKPKPKKPENEVMGGRWVELGKPEPGEEEPQVPVSQEPSETAAEGELPPWLASMQPQEEGGVDELTAWLREADAQAEQHKASPFTEPGLGSVDEAPASSSGALPDWLRNLQQEQAAVEETPQAESPADIETDSDWLKKLQQEEPDMPSISTETPAWLKEDTAPREGEQSETPAWLRSTQAFTEKEPAAEEAEPGDLPDWLKAAAPKSSVFEEGPSAPAPSARTETPDWLATLQADAGLASEPEKSEEPVLPAFTDESLTGENADALFTEMPDWLTNAAGEEPAAPTPSAGTPAGEAESIAPGDLPSWVQAMRPVEASVGQGEAGAAGEQTLETSGALAGLQGVLPAVAGFGPTSKPKPYSITLNASEEQLAHATLLEQILAAETAPEPIASFAPLAAQRGLRWLLAFLLFGVLTIALGLRLTLFTLPAGESSENRDARAIMGNLPPSAPVLVVVDYEPALAGEMEAVAVPLLSQGVMRKTTLEQPMFTFISTSPTGGLLAENLISVVVESLASEPMPHPYERGTNYVNLGYLPGGLSGVRAFALSPRDAAPFAMESTFLKPVRAWELAPLVNIQSLSQFKTIVVITDNAESGRTWIEQTAEKRPETPIIMVTSAQAAPMIQPYYEARQISAMVGGLHGGAITEQGNGDAYHGLVENYWSPFSIGLLLTVVLILIGGLWNFGLGLRDRALEGK